ncbi:MAG TPA: DJ-1/PfpI family protein [Blastocatellia bacterium]|nr:DJ-1/PfpI family protein [Blastocatellia bacterium]
MQVSLITFDQFTDIDLYLLWDLLNRVRVPGWRVSILGTQEQHISQSGLPVATHGVLEETRFADAVLFVSGPRTRELLSDRNWLQRLSLDPKRQLVGSMCSGALLLAALGLLNYGEATTYPTAKEQLESFGVTVVEKPFALHGNVATAAGCLAAQYLAGWVIEKLVNRTWRELVLKSIQPIGEGLSFADAEKLRPLYGKNVDNSP